MGSIAAGAGVVKVEDVVYLSYAEKFNTSPLSDATLKCNYSRVAYSDTAIQFLERFDTDSTNNWSYAESGNGTATTGYTISGSTINMSVKHGSGGDATNVTYATYTHTATKGNGLKPTSGVIIWGRIMQTAGTPIHAFELSDATYYLRAGFDGSGNIDLDYHNAAGSATNVPILATATTDHWYSIMIEHYGTTGIVTLYNATGVQKGDSNEVTTKMTYSNYDRVIIRTQADQSTAETGEFDWLYSTKKVTTPDQDLEATAKNETSGAPISDEESDVEFSMVSAGIENDSASAEARNAFEYTATASDYEGKKTYNSSEFEGSMSTVSEYNNDIQERQDYYAMGWNDLQDDTETALEKSIEDSTGIDCHLVDYYVDDVTLDWEFDENFQKLTEEFYKKEAVDVIFEEDPEATVTFEDGSVMSAAMVPREIIAAWLIGCTLEDLVGHATAAGIWDSVKGVKGSIKKVSFTSSAKAKAVREKVSKQCRKKVSNGLGIIQGNIKTRVSKTKSTVKKATNYVQRKSNAGTFKKVSRNYAVAATNKISTTLKTGSTSVKSTLGRGQDIITSGGKFIKEKSFGVFGFASKIATKITRYLTIGLAIVGIIVIIVIIGYAYYKSISLNPAKTRK